MTDTVLPIMINGRKIQFLSGYHNQAIIDQVSGYIQQAERPTLDFSEVQGIDGSGFLTLVKIENISKDYGKKVKAVFSPMMAECILSLVRGNKFTPFSQSSNSIKN